MLLAQLLLSITMYELGEHAACWGGGAGGTREEAYQGSLCLLPAPVAAMLLIFDIPNEPCPGALSSGRRCIAYYLRGRHHDLVPPK